MHRHTATCFCSYLMWSALVGCGAERAEEATISLALTANGEECASSSDCASGYCFPGPPRRACEPPTRYCLAASMNCAQPGTEGVQFGSTYDYEGRNYECKAGLGLGIANGQPCDDPDPAALHCASGYCYPGPNGQRFCL